MRNTKTVSALLIFCILISLMTGCTNPAAGNKVAEGVYKPGTYSASAKGFGGDVNVTIEVDANKILTVNAEGKNETDGVGSKAIEQLPKKIVEEQKVDVDGISGATLTSNALLSAAKTALNEAMGIEKPQGKMKPGTYTASGLGFRLFEEVEVNVTVDETSILAIEVSTDNGETKPILQSVIDKMVPRMIEGQSINVDAITGATASSNAVRTAVTEALTAAYVAGGSSPDSVDTFKKDPVKNTDKAETINTKVLVLGLGGSGITAAMRAAEKMYEVDPSKVDVLAIDKAGKFGGTSSVTSEMFAVNAPNFQEEFNGGKDYVNKEQLRDAWLKYTEGDAKTEMVDLLLDNSGKVVDWLMYDHGFKFSTPKRGFTEADVYEVKYQYLPNDTGTKEYAKTYSYFEGIMDDYTELGGKFMLETEAYELMYDNESKTVKGVKARSYDGKEYEIYADAIVLATGGFAGNVEMETKYFSNEYYPLNGEWKQYGMHQNDDTFNNNTQLLKQEYEYTKNLIERMESHLSFTRKLTDEQIQFKIDKSPTFYCFDYMVDNEITIEDCYLKHFVQWAEHMLFVLNYSPCSLESLSNGSTSLRIGLAVEEKHLNLLNLNVSKPVYMRTSKLSIICPIRHYLNGKLIEKYAEKLQEFILNNNITTIGELFYVNEVSFHQNGEEHFYSKLYIPLE